MSRSDPHVTRYELPHGSQVRPVRVFHEVVSKSTQLHVTVYFQVGIHKEICKLKGIKMPLLKNENRARALGMLECGISQHDVARRVGVSISTFARLVQRVNNTGSLSDRPRSGAPRVTSLRQDVFIRQRHLRGRFTTSQSTSYVVVGNRGRTVSRNTVRNRLRERGIFYRRPQRGVILMERRCRDRRKWAQNNVQRHWRTVVFSDGSRFNLSSADGRVRVYRRRHERCCKSGRTYTILTFCTG